MINIIFRILKYCWLFIAGASLGSFFAALVYRLQHLNSVKQILWSRSSCDNCGHMLHVRDLFPVLSYISLRGKCRYCSHKISVKYFLVEIFLGGLTTIFYFSGEFSMLNVVIFLFLSFFAVSDILNRQISAIPVDLFVLFSIVYSLWTVFLSFNFFTIIASALLLLVWVFRGKIGDKFKGLGLGDILILLSLALLLKEQILFIFLGASLSGILFFIAMWIVARIDRNYPIPFVPFILFAFLMSLFYY